MISSTAGKNSLAPLDSHSHLITISPVRWLHFLYGINLHSSGKFPQQSQMLPPGASRATIGKCKQHITCLTLVVPEPPGKELCSDMLHGAH